MSNSTPLKELINNPDLAALQLWLTETGVLDIAEELSRLDTSDMAVPFRLLDRDRALAVFEALDPVHQQQILEGIRDNRYRQLLEDMEPNDRARLVNELPATIASRLLQGLSLEERAMTAALLGYPEESAGRIMSPQFVSLRETQTVADGIAKVRRDGVEAETVYLLLVTDDRRKLKGVVSLRELVLSPPNTKIRDIMTKEVHSVHVNDDQEVAARLIHDADLMALPVLDSEDRLVGVLSVDDAMKIIEEEDTEDLALHSASQPLGRPYLSASVFGLARVRAMWLLILIGAAALTVNVLQHYETTLNQVVTLALFIPLLGGTGGNSGAQASTTVIRALAVGEIRFSDLPQIVWREARVGLILGVMLAAAGYFPIRLFFDADIALIVALTLVVVCTWATFAGSMLPLVARKIGIDPAVFSAPVITTLVDATGLVIYFLIAQAVLGI